MSLDLNTLQLLKYRVKYDKLAKAVPAGALTTQTQIILSDFGRWFREFEGADRIDFALFPQWFKSVHPTVRDEALAVFAALFKQADKDVAPHIEQGLAKRWLAAEFAHEQAKLLERWNAGEEVDLTAESQRLAEQYAERLDRQAKDAQVLDPIEDLLKDEQDERGIHWPWPSFNKVLKPLVGGDFVVVAMRPDAGKSTWCAHFSTHAAPQLDEVWPGERRTVMILNNEGPGKRIVTRCFQAAGGWTIEEMTQLSAQAPTDPKYKSKLRELYAAALGGRLGSLKVFDIHGYDTAAVEDLFIKHKPGVVVFDMVDNVTFGGVANNGGTRTDQLLEAMYQWARLLGVKHDAIMIANSQISGDGEGVQWPSMGMLKDSKTGKQGASDLQLMGSRLDDAVLEHSRFWSAPKNKKRKTGAPALKQELILQGDRARYVEPPQ